MDNNKLKTLCKLTAKPEVFNHKACRVFTQLYNFNVTRMELLMIEELVCHMFNEYWSNKPTPRNYFHASNQLLLTNIDLCLN